MRDTSQNDAFLREVQSDLQRMKLQLGWKKYGLPVAALVLILALGLGGWRFWQARQTDRLTEQGLRYEAALSAEQQGKKDTATRTYQEMARSGEGGYAVLAALRVAAAQGSDLTLLNTLAGDARQDPMVRDAAAVLAGYRATGPVPGAVRARLETIGSGAGPWQHLAREALALNAVQAGLTAEGAKALRALQDDPTLPAPNASRVAALLATLPAAPVQPEKK